MNRRERRANGKTAPGPGAPTPNRLSPQFHFNAANTLMSQGRYEEAVASLTQSIKLEPRHPDSHFNLGNALTRLRRLEDAEAAYRQAIRLKPDHLGALTNLGILLRVLGRPREALEAFEACVAVTPRDPAAHNNLGHVQRSMGQLDLAAAAYRTALGLAPAAADSHFNLANALADQDQARAAEAAYKTAIALSPDYVEAYSNLGAMLKDQGRLAEAVASFRKSLDLRAGAVETLVNLGNALTDGGELEEAVLRYREAIRLQPDLAAAHSNLLFALHYHEDADGLDILGQARQYAAIFAGQAEKRDFPNVPGFDRRIRIGYVSADLRRHPVGYFLDGVLQSHNASSFEVFCFSNSKREDDLTDRLRSAAHHWRSIVGLNDAAAADLIAGDEIDILVDLSGHTAHNRLGVFALRPAPVQITWLGYWGTTGLPEMDYILSDRITIRPGEEQGYSEAVLRLPGNRFCYAPPSYAPPPRAHSRPDGSPITFGSFNSLAKVGPAVIRLWARVLGELPGSRLLLKRQSLTDSGLRRKLTRDFEALGISAERLVFRDGSPHEEMLEEYGDVDVALDPFPFTGGLTSCEALLMGVPVVTMPGKPASSRQTEGILDAIGCRDWVAGSADDYVRIAVELAKDAEMLARLRQDLRRRILESPLCDASSFTRGLESALRTAWVRWCEKVG